MRFVACINGGAMSRYSHTLDETEYSYSGTKPTLFDYKILLARATASNYFMVWLPYVAASFKIKILPDW